MSAPRVLRVALVGGPQYDVLYTRIPIFEASTGYRVEIECQLPHPELNTFVARAFALERPPALDLISTHIKYAPAQAHFLTDLAPYIGTDEVAAFLPAATRASRVGTALLQMPRMVDARLMFYRADLLRQAEFPPPTTWDELERQALALTVPGQRFGFVFPGRYSGLFGTFFELAAMAGGSLFDPRGRPVFERHPVEWALGFLHRLYAQGAVPPELVSWHYDEVSACFRGGRAAFVCDWPAFFGLYDEPSASAIAGCYGVARYPLGPARLRSVYAGMHSFAVPVTACDVSASVALLRFLLDEESQWLEAQHGAFPTRRGTLERLQRSLTPGSLSAQRLELLTATVQEDMLMFPPLVRYPVIEDELWPIVQQAIVGTMPVPVAAASLRDRAYALLEDPSEGESKS